MGAQGQRHAPRRGLAGAGLLLLLMGACASSGDLRTAKNTAKFGNDAAGAVFAGAYRNIADYFIEPLPIETVAMAGLEKLGTPENGFSFKRANHTLTFFDHAMEIQQIETPAANDSDGWGAVTSAAIGLARTHVPELATETDEALYQKVFSGIIPKLDRFSRYAGKDQARNQKATREGFGGIGITLDYTDKTPKITMIQADGPANRAGLKMDDRLVAIDDTPVAGLEPQAIVDKLRGTINTKVSLTVLRQEKPITVQLTRALITIPTVNASREDGLLVIRIGLFNHGTADAVMTELAKAKRDLGKNLHGIVLDLRGNPGGLLDQAVELSGLFIDHGLVGSSRGRHPNAQQNFASGAKDQARGLPVAVLVNGGSASASEIVASALQDSGRAVVIGSSSFGKGTVQMVITLDNKSEFTLTWAKLYTPTGTLLHEHGVVPSFCTSRATNLQASDDEKVQAIIDRGLHPSGTIEIQKRVSLNETGWTELRNSCPTQTVDNALDLKLAKEILRSPSIYAQALTQPAISVANAPEASKQNATNQLQ